MKSKLAAFLALLLVASGPLFSLEAKSGRMKVVVSESNARLSVYYLKDPAKNAYVPLIYDQDPRTSFASLSLDSKVYRLGDSSDFRFAVTAIPTGIQVDFRSSVCIVRQKIEFLFSPGAAAADGVSVTFSVENVSDRDISAGLRYLLDTYLGEKSGEHFRTDARAKIGEETLITAASADRYVVSAGDGTEFMCMVKGGGITVPDSVILANWKRISDSPWAIETSSSRNFTQLPYSINDSAIALHYNPAIIARGGTRTIVVAMGVFNESGFQAGASAAGTTGAIGAVTAVTSSSSAGTVAQVQTDIAALRDLLRFIDERLASGAPVTEEELAAIRALLDAIEGRLNSY